MIPKPSESTKSLVNPRPSWTNKIHVYVQWALYVTDRLPTAGVGGHPYILSVFPSASSNVAHLLLGTIPCKQGSHSNRSLISTASLTQTRNSFTVTVQGNASLLFYCHGSIANNSTPRLLDHIVYMYMQLWFCCLNAMIAQLPAADLLLVSKRSVCCIQIT